MPQWQKSDETTNKFDASSKYGPSMAPSCASLQTEPASAQHTHGVHEKASSATNCSPQLLSMSWLPQCMAPCQTTYVSGLMLPTLQPYMRVKESGSQVKAVWCNTETYGTVQACGVCSIKSDRAPGLLLCLCLKSYCTVVIPCPDPPHPLSLPV